MTTRQTIKRFLEPVKNHKKITILVLFHTFLRSLWWLLLLYFNKQIAIATELWDSDMVIRYVIYFWILTILSYISVIFLEKYYDFIFWEVQRTIYTKHLNKTINLDNNSFETIGTWYFNSVLQKWWDNRASLLKEWLVEWVWACIEIIFAFILIYNAAWNYGLLFAWIALLISIIVMNRGTRISISRRRKKRKEYGLMDKQTVRIIMSKFEILLNNRIWDETKKLHQWWQKIMTYHNFDRKWIIIAYVIPRFTNEILRWMIYFFVWIWVITWKYSIADYILLITVIGLFRSSIIWLISIYRNFAKNFLYVTRLWNMFDTIPEIHWIDKWKELIVQNTDIDISWISYAYKHLKSIESIEWETIKNWKKEIKVFNNFFLDIIWKQKTALVWPSWWGKSTLMKLIAGYLQPDSGSVIVDGQDLKNVSLLSYYKHIGYLTQEPSVFDWTIRENLMYWTSSKGSEIPEKKSLNASENSELSEIIKLAKCERIYDLPQWLDTEIGERGVRLSGGQKQRLAIAKIMLKNPDIILLDEPTSALDSANEQAVTEALNNLFKNKTVIIIAHRLQTVKNADDIIYIAEGKVIERGTHDELLALWWEYYTMVELQSGF
jgi:ABC-type multidrug transport system fused ATPase/permease subunit